MKRDRQPRWKQHGCALLVLWWAAPIAGAITISVCIGSRFGAWHWAMATAGVALFPVSHDNEWRPIKRVVIPF